VTQGTRFKSPVDDILTRSDPLYHKKLRGQIAPKSRFVEVVDLRDINSGQAKPQSIIYSRIREYLTQAPNLLW
jgi:hypothetical protein